MKFSIIMPTFNRVHTIERAIKSIQLQNYENWEIIIIDDGSTDDTEKVLKNYLRCDNRIKYFKMDQNSGVGKARNFGFKNISTDSEWIGFLDSDDIFVDNAFELMKNKIEEFSEIKHFSFSTQYQNGEKACYIKHDNFLGSFETVLGKNNDVFGEFNSLLHRSIIEDGFHFEESVNGYEWIAWLRLSKKNFKHLYTTSTIIRIYVNEGESLLRTSNKDKKYYKNAKKGIELIFSEFGSDLKKNNKYKYSIYLYTLGNYNLLLGNKLIGLKQTLHAIKYNPFNIRLIRNLINVFKY